jgi:hypothetical protein
MLVRTVFLGSGVSIAVGGGEKTLVRAVSSAPFERAPPLELYYIVVSSNLWLRRGRLAHVNLLRLFTLSVLGVWGGRHDAEVKSYGPMKLK